jgi:hypothetical protein
VRASNISGIIATRCRAIPGDCNEGPSNGLDGAIAGKCGWGDASECRLERIRAEGWKLGSLELSLPEKTLERISSVVVMDPRRKAVPRVLNLGVPSLYEGIGTSRVGMPSKLSRDLGPVPGLSITTLNAPTSESRTGRCCSSMVEYECARWRCGFWDGILHCGK